METSEKIWMNGQLVAWEQARIHVLSHVVHYGSGVFEGIRCYRTRGGPAVFRLPEHVQRLLNSAKVHRMLPSYGAEQLTNAILETIRANRLEACYIRPIVYRGYGEMGVSPLGCPVDVAIAVWKWGTYLGQEALEKGVDVQISTWVRPSPNAFPSEAKAAANYLNSQLVKMEALANGYSEGISLDQNGHVAEGSGENLFMVRGGRLITPPLYSAILAGITRDSVITLAHEMQIAVEERPIQRGELYLADEIFLTGTAAELTPIRSVDRVGVGEGARGPLTRRLQEAFFSVVNGEKTDTRRWLTPVNAK